MATEQCPPKEILEFQDHNSPPLFNKKKAIAADIISRWLNDWVYCEDSQALRVCMDSPFGPDIVYKEDELTDVLTRLGLLVGGIELSSDEYKALKLTDDGRLMVDAAVTVENANFNVQLTHLDDYPFAGDIHDSVRIGDGTDLVQVNPDGSLNVVIVPSSSGTEVVKTIYTEVIGIAKAVDTLLVTYTVPVGKTAELLYSDFSGENISEYRILLNSVVIDKKRTYFGAGLNEEFNFKDTRGGIPLVAGDVVEVKTIHNRPMVGDFNARIQVLEIG